MSVYACPWCRTNFDKRGHCQSNLGQEVEHMTDWYIKKPMCMLYLCVFMC